MPYLSMFSEPEFITDGELDIELAREMQIVVFMSINVRGCTKENVMLGRLIRLLQNADRYKCNTLHYEQYARTTYSYQDYGLHFKLSYLNLVFLSLIDKSFRVCQFVIFWG